MNPELIALIAAFAVLLIGSMIAAYRRRSEWRRKADPDCPVCEGKGWLWFHDVAGDVDIQCIHCWEPELQKHYVEHEVLD